WSSGRNGLENDEKEIEISRGAGACSMSPQRHLSYRLAKPVLLSAVGFYVAPVAAQQVPPLQLNVPYHCENNTIVVVKHCEKRNGTEQCSLVKGPPNGPLGSEIILPKDQAAAIGLMCSLGGQAQAGPGAKSSA